MNDHTRPNKAIVSIIVIVLIGLTAGALYYVNQPSQDEEVTVESTSDQPVDRSVQSDTDANDEYKDGSYEATGSYSSPGGREEITVTVVLTNGKISETSAKTEAASGTSRQYQSEFVDNYKNLVVGRSLSEIKLDRVAGSSLTSNGFNDALDMIKNDAAA